MYALRSTKNGRRREPKLFAMSELDTPTRVVLITGSSSGIGAALARRLAADGVRLALHGRNRESATRLEAVAAQCRAAGAPQCTALYADLSEAHSAGALVQATLDAFGALDQLVSNAGYARQGGVADGSWESLASAFAVMPASFAALLRAAAPALVSSPCASVVAVSSFIAHRLDAATPFAEGAAARAALEALVRSAALEFAERAITVNAVVPGFTRKDTAPAADNSAAWARARARTPSGRIAEPDDIAAAIRFLLSADARHITGAILPIDGGLTAG